MTAALCLALMQSAVAAPTVGQAHAGELCGSDTQPCERARAPLRMRSLVLFADSTRAPGIDGIDCRRFKLSRAAARRYLYKSGEISEGDSHQIASDSECIATGYVLLQSGERLNWRIGEQREGLLTWPDGRKQYLFCGRCGRPPFTAITPQRAVTLNGVP